MVLNAAVIDVLSGDNTLLDAVLIEFDIHCVEGASFVDLKFTGRKGSKFSKFKLQFSEIIRFDISFDTGEIPIDVWDLKFIQLKDLSFYISLDPDPSTLKTVGVIELDACNTDKFVVCSKSVELFIMETSNSS